MDNRILAAFLVVAAIIWPPADSCAAFKQSPNPNFGVSTDADSTSANKPNTDGIELIVLGIAQDAGFPQAGCVKACCRGAWKNPNLRRNVASVGVIDHSTGQRWLFDCTPDFPNQLRMLDERTQLVSPQRDLQQSPGLEGIFLTHAHIGHYAGLIHLGREVMGAQQTPAYAMPRMREFLTKNGPWSQLVKLENIKLVAIQADQEIRLNERLTVTPIQVPHRDEFSETVGFKITGPNKTIVFLPDIDKWSKWNRSIENLLAETDIAYLDGTFFENGEIPGRDMALIPHPFVAESINRFSPLDETVRKKVRFIHFNHTNPVLQNGSAAARDIERAGMNIAAEGEVIDL